MLVTVSVAALAIALPDIADAADLATKAPVYKAAPAAKPVITAYIEGGPMWTAGGSVNYLDPEFGVNRTINPGVGWTAAAGIDYRLAGSPWHLSADFRYGKGRDKSESFSSLSITPPGFSSGLTSAHHDEDHWVADFMVGRDIGLGAQSQVKFGVRVADLRATTDVTGGGSTVFPIASLTFSSAFTMRSRFLGAGPRAAIDGTVAIQGPWSLDYRGGLAVLYGDRELNQTGGGTFCISIVGCSTTAFNGSFNSSGWVPNADASLALSYAVTPAARISAGYQVDHYWSALRTFDAGGNPVSVDRDYSGPFVRLTGQF